MAKSTDTKLSSAESRLAFAKLMEAVQNASYHGEVTLVIKRGELASVRLSQTGLPRDILEETFGCVVLTTGRDDESEESRSH